jgi:hypothetical protein
MTIRDRKRKASGKARKTRIRVKGSTKPQAELFKKVEG